MGSQTHQLDRLGRELKCPICLSLLQHAASLTCNHTFCRSCILQSMKSKPCCPICQVHTTRREVRAAPQMDSLVAIFISMGSAAGLDISSSQKLPITNCSKLEIAPNDAPSMGKCALLDITNCQKSEQNSKDRLKASDYTFKGALPAKKRIQVPQPSTVDGAYEANRCGIHSSPHKSGPILVDNSPKFGVSSKTNKRKKSLNEIAAGKEHSLSSKRAYGEGKRQCLLVKQSGSKQLDIEIPQKEIEMPAENSSDANEYPSKNKKVNRRKGDDLEDIPCTHLANNMQKGLEMPGRDYFNRRPLDPFFWVRDVSSQDTDAVQGTQLTLTQSTLRPNFSDLKNSNEESDLDANEEVAKSTDVCEPATYDSDDFDWTQHPCSPEIRCSPSKNKDLGIDIPLEVSNPSAIEVQLEVNNSSPRQLQTVEPTENLVESACEVFSTAQDIHVAAVKKGKKSRSSGRKKAHHEIVTAVDLNKDMMTSRKANSEQQQMLAGLVSSSHSELHCDTTFLEERKQVKLYENCKKISKKPGKLHKGKLIQGNTNVGSSSKPESSDIYPCDINESEVLNLPNPIDVTKRNEKCGKLTKGKADKTTRLCKRKHVQEDNGAGCPAQSKSSVEQPCRKSFAHQSSGIFPSEVPKLGKPASDSSNKSDRKPVKLSKSKHGSNCGDAKDCKPSLKPEGNKDSAAQTCVFCGLSDGSQITGSMMHYDQQGTPLAGPEQDGKIIHTHKHCAEWAPDVYFDEDQARNLSAEASRGLKIKCFTCGKRGAALGCCIKRCRRSYHYPCARSLSCKWKEDCFIMLCPEHKDENFPVKKGSRRAHSRAASTEVAIQQPAAGVSKDISIKWASCTLSSKWVLCGSALDAAGKNQLAKFAKLTGATVSKAWNSNVTHVIAGTDIHGAARRTMKFLMAILEGKWIVNLEWPRACIEAGKPVSEGSFEIQSDIHGATDGPKHGRLRAASKGPKLFEKLQFYFMPDFLSSLKGDMQTLVLAGGGGVLHRRPVAFADDDDDESVRRTIVVYSNESSSNDKEADTEKLKVKSQAEAQELAAIVGGMVAPHQWILNSIGSSKVQPLD